ncbi:hypothetical protein EDB85DRAFT_393934 [Lactarius pseudohatsudake]|nr:hypothetical protein EDB85DRAFT_393934 [Lactarius pseudohatsudake]
MVQRKTCSYWLKGRCTFGKKCRNSHDIPSESAIGPDASRSATAAATVRIPATQHGDTCPYFVKGTCRFGDRCRWSHRLATEAQTPPSRPFAVPKPCKFFPKGRCNKGENCPFGHTVSNSVMFDSVDTLHRPVPMRRPRIEQSPTLRTSLE